MDPVHELVPVYPTCHYVMGGIPTTVTGQVLRDNTHVVPGLFAAGECACVSVHGANRLGTNSLLDINVFGRRAGIAAARYARGHDFVDMPAEPASMVVGWVADILSEHGNERVADIRGALQQTMDNNAAVFRTEETSNRHSPTSTRSRSGIPASPCTTRGSGSTAIYWKPSNWAFAGAGRSHRGRRIEPQGVPRRARPRGLPQPR